MISDIFFDRMKDILKDEYPAFEAALGMPAVKAVRVNTGKISRERFLESTSLDLTPLPYCDEGFILESADGIGNTPEHASGMIYVQDPGAMSAVSAVDIRRGDLVLDCCAAPGGKSSQAYSKIGDEGLLVANEFVPKRAKICVSNFERLGFRSALVLSLDTAELAGMYRGVFDVVICDAPCSGEGMFRKYDEARGEWSAENVASSAKRQKEILSNVAPTVKAGGVLLYSTCTYSIEENEEVVLDFLERHPDFHLIPPSERVRPYVSEGIPIAGHEELLLTSRFYPHKSRGEGQFAAVLKRGENADVSPTILYKDAGISPTKEECRIALDFLKENLVSLPDCRLIKRGELISMVPKDLVIPKSSVFSAGVCLGEIRGKNLFPHHHFFSAYGRLFKRRVDLSRDDGRVLKYLRGEEISVDTAASGFCAVCYEGAPLGGGKISLCVVKNHYPKGLRIKN